MSFDLHVEGGRWVALDAWCAGAAVFGAELALHAGIDLVTHHGWLPVRLRVVRADAFPRAGEYVAAGPFRAGFKLMLYVLPPDAPAEAIARRLANPDVDSDEREALHTGTTQLSLGFGVPWHGTEAEFISMYIAAAAFAHAGGGELRDPQRGVGARGDAITPLLQALFERPIEDRSLEPWSD